MSAYVTADRGIRLDELEHLHEFAHCHLSDENFQTVLAYGRGNLLTETLEIPGHPECSSSIYHRIGGPTAVRGRVNTLVVLRRMYNCLWLIHRSGITLRGNFSARNFLVSRTMQVRMHRIHSSRWNATDEDQDHLAFRESVEEFFGQEETPQGIIQWLSLMRRGGRGYVVRYHPHLMDPLQQVGWLMSCRSLFEGLRTSDNNLYLDMIYRLRDYNDWMAADLVNTLMVKAYKYEDPETHRRPIFRSDIIGVLKLLRDCKEHPAKECGDLFPLVVADDFPKLLSDLHEAMYRARLLPQLHLEASMA